MSRGYPDYFESVGRTAEGEYLPQISNPPVWFEDDFNSPLCRWLVTAGTVTLDQEETGATLTIYPYHGDAFMKIETGVIFGWVSFNIGVVPLVSNIGVSVVFNFVKETDYDNDREAIVIIDAYFQTPTTTIEFSVSYNPRDYKWYNLNADGANYDYMFTYRIFEEAWHYIKLIVNPIKLEYVRFQIDNYVHDLRGISYHSAAPGGASRYFVQIYYRRAALKNPTLLIDNYKITYGET